ncbi:MAG: Lin0512 family protein [Deltaproteobacteria bacterium]|nr:Lin0512 family protein [Deltaproteobacteria bacterium]
MRKRFIVEIGMGTDLHGQDVTKASCRAVQDAISRSCLCGLQEILALPRLDDMVVEVKIATPLPDQVDHEAVLSEIPFGHKNIQVVEGGLSVPTLFDEQQGDINENTVVALAAVTVWVDVQQ